MASKSNSKEKNWDDIFALEPLDEIVNKQDEIFTCDTNENLVMPRSEMAELFTIDINEVVERKKHYQECVDICEEALKLRKKFCGEKTTEMLKREEYKRKAKK